MDTVSIEKVIQYVKDNNDCTVEDVLKMLYPDADKYTDKVLVHAVYYPYYAQPWKTWFLLTTTQHRVLNGSNPSLRLSNVDGKYGDADVNWLGMLSYEIDNKYEIARIVANESIESIHYYSSLTDVLSNWDKIIQRDYINKLLDKFIKDQSSKPDTSYNIEEDRFNDQQLMDITSNMQLEMEQLDLGCDTSLYDLWNREMIKTIDDRWGGHSVILDNTDIEIV